MLCTHCGKETTNKKFCSSKCSGTYNYKGPLKSRTRFTLIEAEVQHRKANPQETCVQFRNEFSRLQTHSFNKIRTAASQQGVPFNPVYIICRGCGKELPRIDAKSRRQQSNYGAGYCSNACKAKHGFCASLCCFQSVLIGYSYCSAHKIDETIRQTRQAVNKAAKWCQQNNCSLENLPKTLPFDRGWPDNPVACQELKIGGDHLRWEQIIRFNWIKQYYGREVSILWTPSFLSAICGESRVFSNWMEHRAWLKKTFHEMRAAQKLARAANFKTPFSPLSSIEDASRVEKSISSTFLQAA